MINSVYIAYPIDQRGPASLVHLFDQINTFKAMISSRVSWVFDPGDAFRVNPEREIDPGLAIINRAALNNADAVVAFLPRGVPSIGVPMEIDRARAQGKVVAVFSDAESYMLEMAQVARFHSWEDAALVEAEEWLMEQEPYDGTPVLGDLRFTGDERCAPLQVYGDDAGFDLTVSEDTVIPGGEFRDVPCGISVELPERTWAMITGRSSTLRKRGLLVSTGIIDTGYRGPLFAGVQDLNPDGESHIKTGERIAQLILFSNLAVRYRPLYVKELSPSARGTNGFGSTGA